MTTTDEQALARSDRYLREFVEALRLCPYARSCRESGRLQRRVLRSRDDAFPAIQQIEALPEQAVEVVLLIFPDEPASGEQSARYLAEFDFRYSTRKLSDTQRMHRLMGQVAGRRLAYRPFTGGR